MYVKREEGDINGIDGFEDGRIYLRVLVVCLYENIGLVCCLFIINVVMEINVRKRKLLK